MAELHLVPGSREATPSSGKEKPSDVAIHSAKEGAKNGRKSLKHRPQGTTTTTDLDDGDDGKVGGYGGGCAMTIAHSNNCQARPPTYQLKRLIKEAYPNHTYLVRHKLKDYDMMKSFMILGSRTCGMELGKDRGGSDMMPFHREDAVMILYGGRPSPRRRRVSTLSPGAPTHCGWGTGT
jgi:hypothetical protein